MHLPSIDGDLAFFSLAASQRQHAWFSVAASIHVALPTWLVLLLPCAGILIPILSVAFQEPLCELGVASIDLLHLVSLAVNPVVDSIPYLSFFELHYEKHIIMLTNLRGSHVYIAASLSLVCVCT